MSVIARPCRCRGKWLHAKLHTMSHVHFQTSAHCMLLVCTEFVLPDVLKFPLLTNSATLTVKSCHVGSRVLFAHGLPRWSGTLMRHRRVSSICPVLIWRAKGKCHRNDRPVNETSLPLALKVALHKPKNNHGRVLYLTLIHQLAVCLETDGALHPGLKRMCFSMPTSRQGVNARVSWFWTAPRVQPTWITVAI